MVPKRGQVFLWSGKNPVAKLIQWFTGSKWSHCGFILEGNKIIDSDFSIYPSEAGVRVRDFEEYLKYPERIQLIDLKFEPEQVEKILEEAHFLVGKAYYDLPLIFSFIWEWWEGDGIFDKMVHLESAYTCSEFVSYCINKITNHPIIEGRHIHSIRPHELEVLI